MIPLTKPYVPAKTYSELSNVLGSSHLQGGGVYSKKCENRLSEILGTEKVKLTPSCTSALELSSQLMDLKKDDEVIMPSFNFTSAAIAVVNYGAVPVFVDVDRHTKCIAIEQIEEQITPKTRAISWVNYGGFAPDLRALKRIAERYQLFLVEDNAHALGSTYEGTKLGSISDFSVYSFHATKNIQCGEGGAINIKNHEFWNQAEYMVEKGTNRFDYESGTVNKYTWVEKGGSYVNSEILSAMLMVQLESFDEIQERRRLIYETYLQELKQYTLDLGFEGSFLEVDKQHAAHLFFLEFNNQQQRNQFISSMKSHGITTAFHYQALHTSKGGRKYGRSSQYIEVATKTAENIVRLPLFYNLRDLEIQRVIEFAKKVMEEVSKLR